MRRVTDICFRLLQHCASSTSCSIITWPSWTQLLGRRYESYANYNHTTKRLKVFDFYRLSRACDYVQPRIRKIPHIVMYINIGVCTKSSTSRGRKKFRTKANVAHYTHTLQTNFEYNTFWKWMSSLQGSIFTLISTSPHNSRPQCNYPFALVAYHTRTPWR